MNNLSLKARNLLRRKYRIRAGVSGTSERPRLTVHISNRHVTAQIIDDTAHKTLAYVTSAGNSAATGTLTDKAIVVGKEIAKKAKVKKIKTVVFDRNGKLFHGRIKALADAARAGGLEF